MTKEECLKEIETLEPLKEKLHNKMFNLTKSQTEPGSKLSWVKYTQTLNKLCDEYEKANKRLKALNKVLNFYNKQGSRFVL